MRTPLTGNGVCSLYGQGPTVEQALADLAEMFRRARSIEPVQHPDRTHPDVQVRLTRVDPSVIAPGAVAFWVAEAKWQRRG